MKTAILLSYTGIGSNLLHLSYCHQIAKKETNVKDNKQKLKEKYISGISTGTSEFLEMFLAC